MRVLVTGSSGFIGTAVVNRLVEKGHQVLGVDRKGPKPDTASHEFVEADILDRERIGRCFAEFRPEGMI
ncbi:MAG: NAD-dependent epimerase/dehydratase family protein, partial [Verrucomicrobiales bacterium]